MNKQQGIVYALTGETMRGVVSGYHHKPGPVFLNAGAKSSDIKNLKKKDKINVLLETGTANDPAFESRFTIGFEVEKTSLHRNSVKEYELFCGFERDGSCGYEAVTHILPLVGDSMWKTKVFDMMWKARRIIDDTFSPSDQKCGGHITVAVKDMKCEELMVRMRKFSGILYSVYKGRLKNGYCSGNNRMLTRDEWDELNAKWYRDEPEVQAMHPSWRKRNGRYEVAIFKGSIYYDGTPVEFRLPSRVTSVHTLMRRYELFYELVNTAVNTPDMSFNMFIRKVRPILVSMYDGNSEKVAEVIKLAKPFQDYINTGIADSQITQYLQS